MGSAYVVLRYVTAAEGASMPQSDEAYEVLRRTGSPGAMLVEQLGFDRRPTLAELAALIPETVPRSTAARFFVIDRAAGTVELREVRVLESYEEVGLEVVCDVRGAES